MHGVSSAWRRPSEQRLWQNPPHELARQIECEVPFIRDAQLVANDTPSLDVVLDVIEKIPGFDIVVLLQPTSPLRTATHIDNAIRLRV